MRTFFALWFLLSFYLLLFLAKSQPSQIGCLPYFHTWCGLSANLGCRSETCCLWLAENTGRKKPPSAHHRTTLSGYIFATKAHIDNRKKNLLSSNISSRCPHNMVNFGLLAAEIVSLVWGTPDNFNAFRVLAALLHGTPVVGVSQTLPRVAQRAPPIFGRRPSRWALAHILVVFILLRQDTPANNTIKDSRLLARL